MLLSFVLAALAGYAAPHAEPLLRRLAGAVREGGMTLDAVEARVATLLVLLLVASLLTVALGQRTSGVAVVLGAGLGCFADRLHAFLRDPSGMGVAPEDAWDGKVRPAGENRRTVAPAEDDGDDAAIAAVRAAMGKAPGASEPGAGGESVPKNGSPNNGGPENGGPETRGPENGRCTTKRGTP